MTRSRRAGSALRRVSLAALAALSVALVALWRVPERAAPPQTPEPVRETAVQGPIGGRESLADSGPTTRVEAAARRAAPTLEPRAFEGRLVDARTGRPVAGLEVRIESLLSEPRAVSDRAGLFAIDLPARVAEARATELALAVRAADGTACAVEPSRVRWTPGAAPCTLEVDAGIHFLVELVGPEEALSLDWSAHLELRPPGAEPTRVSVTRPLSHGSPRRVDFRGGLKRSGRLPYLVASADEWSGAVEVPTLDESPAEVLRIEVSRLAVLKGRVAFEDGGTPELTAQLAPVPVRGPGAHDGPTIDLPWSFDAADRGAFRFDGLVPGEYHLGLVLADRLPLFRRVDVTPGVVDLGVLHVPGSAGDAVVAGTIRSESGRAALSVFLQLEALDGSGWARTWWDGEVPELLRAYYQVGGGTVGSGTEKEFLFAQVPAGHYRLRAAGWDGYRYAPEEIVVEAPVRDLEIVRLDASPDFGFGFHVRDARTGAPIEEYRARFHTRHWGKEPSHTWRSGEVVGRIVADGTFAWDVFAPGYVPQWGFADAFAGVGDPRFVTLDLEPGWGVELQVRDGRDPRRYMPRSRAFLSLTPPLARPLVGVRVLADGVEVGRTDAHGRVRIALPAEPRRLELEAEGWVAVPSTSFADGKVLGECPSPEAWMVRRRLR